MFLSSIVRYMYVLGLCFLDELTLFIVAVRQKESFSTLGEW